VDIKPALNGQEARKKLNHTVNMGWVRIFPARHNTAGQTHLNPRTGRTLHAVAAKSLQTVSRFPRETRRRYAAPKSNAFTLHKPM